MELVPLIILSGFATAVDAGVPGTINGLTHGLRPMEKEEETDEKEEDGVTFSLLAIGNGAVDERLREKRRDKRRSADDGDVTCPADTTRALTGDMEHSVLRVSPSRARLPDPRSLFRSDLPVSNRVRKPEFLLN